MKIYLIGGAPKCGKTTLAKALAKQKNISCISVDTLQNIVFYETPEEEIETKFPHREFARKYKNYDELYSTVTTEEIITNYKKQGETSAKAIRSIVETYLLDKESIIIEGHQITPELVCQLKKEFGEEHIVELFLLRADIDCLLKAIDMGEQRVIGSRQRLLLLMQNRR